MSVAQRHLHPSVRIVTQSSIAVKAVSADSVAILLPGRISDSVHRADWGWQHKWGKWRTACEVLVRQWAANDPVAAFGWVRDRARHSNMQPHWAVSVVLQTWAGADPEAAYRAWHSLPDTGPLGAGINDVFGHVTASDARRRLKLALSLTNGQEVIGAFHSLGHDWSEVALGDALAALDAIPDAGQRRWFFEGILPRWAREDPRGAAASLTSFELDYNTSEAWNRVAKEWAAHDIEAALAWVRSLPPGEGRTLAEAAALTQWAATDSPAATAYVYALTAHPERRVLLRNAVEAWFDRDYRAAMAWIQLRPPGKERDELMFEGVRLTAAIDPAEAARISGRPLADERQARGPQGMEAQ